MENNTDTLLENRFPDLHSPEVPLTYDAISPRLPFRLLEPAMIPLRGKRKRHYGISALTAYTEEEEIDGIFLSDEQMHEHYLQLNKRIDEILELDIAAPLAITQPMTKAPKTKKVKAPKKSLVKKPTSSRALKKEKPAPAKPLGTSPEVSDGILKSAEAILTNSNPVTALDSKDITRIARRKNKMEEQIHLSNPKAEEFLKKYVHEQEDKKHEFKQHQQEVVEHDEDVDLPSADASTTPMVNSPDDDFTENEPFAPTPRTSQIYNDHEVDEEKMTREEWLRFMGKDLQSPNF